MFNNVNITEFLWECSHTTEANSIISLFSIQLTVLHKLNKKFKEKAKIDQKTKIMKK